MKIDRLISIIFILLQKDKVTAPELAKRFEVSRRTINRDIADICKVGILLSGKLNDAPSGRLFRADFRTLQMCQSL